MGAPPAGPFAELTLVNRHACALRPDTGTLVCWGDNENNRVGSTPANLELRQVDASDMGACGVRKSDGEVVCWGYEQWGELTGMPNHSAYTQLAPGYQHSCARRQSDGVAECWGDHNFHWANNRLLLEQRQSDSAAAVERALARTVLDLDAAPQKQLRVLDDLLGSTLSTSTYRCLWDEFTTHAEPLLSVTIGTAKNVFEADFLANFAALAASPTGRQLHETLQGLGSKRVELVRMLVAQDTLSWMRRHVFGNVRHHSELGPMPLGSMYVEPVILTDDRVIPIQRWFDEQLDGRNEQVLVITADFGHGKSMSARYLACRMALRYLQSAEPSTACWYPIYVRASDDLSASDNSVDTFVARALRRQTNDREGLHLALSANDPALRIADGRALITIDGFDEIALSPAEVERFFALLRDESSSRRRFIVLGRPEALDRATSQRERWNAVGARIQGFDAEQAQRWIDNWNRHTPERTPVSWHKVESSTLAELARTPVLLFMIAFTLSSTRGNEHDSGINDTVALYETFCFAMARGKLQQSGERHSVIERAARRLADALDNHGWSRSRIPLHPRVAETESDGPASAMLWLMSRVAWEMFVRGDQPLRQRHIETLLERVLDLEDADVDAVIVGSLLALQSNLASGHAHMFFGHRSFQEYLEARFWHIAVAHVATLPSRATQREFEAQNLVGAALVRRDALYSFFLQLENGEAFAARWPAISTWANTCFCDLDEQPPVTKQRRAPLRAASLAIACLRPGFDLITPERHDALMASLMFNWVHLVKNDKWLMFAFPGANLEGIDLRASSIHGGVLTGACFAKSNLRYVNFGSAELAGATFSSADLTQARFDEAHLRSANLENAIAREATFKRADLRQANLTRSDFSGACLYSADLRGSRLQFCDLSGADLRRANLCGADLRGAIIEGADFSGSDLDGCLGLESTAPPPLAEDERSAG